MNSAALRARIIIAVAVVVAVWLGNEIAQQNLFWPFLFGVALAAFALTRVQPLRISSILIGLVVLCYIVGNRGFAQITVTPSLPLLPAEAVLGVAGAILVFRSAFDHTSPFAKEPLNIALLVWICLSSMRILFDVRTFGIVAVRDFATIYYAFFFYLAQDAGSRDRDRTFVLRCFLWGMGILAVVIPIYKRFPDVFLTSLTFRGTPVIFFKGDLEGTFAAAGAVLFFAQYEKRRSWWPLVLCLVLAAWAVDSNNRASMLGLGVASVLLFVAGSKRLALTLGGGAIAATILILTVALFRQQSWQKTPVYDAYERIASLADPSGARNYTGEETSNKGDNNVFRSLWWQLSIEETVHTNPWMGLGWGYDLAESFERIYYPGGNEEFSARSPHNILVTLFARTGIVGFVPFLVVLGAICLRSFRAIRRGGKSAYLWAASWAILISALFGVVLEGPMGAVVFWSLLGLASSYDLHQAEPDPLSKAA